MYYMLLMWLLVNSFQIDWPYTKFHGLLRQQEVHRVGQYEHKEREICTKLFVNPTRYASSSRKEGRGERELKCRWGDIQGITEDRRLNLGHLFPQSPSKSRILVPRTPTGALDGIFRVGQKFTNKRYNQHISLYNCSSITVYDPNICVHFAFIQHH